MSSRSIRRFERMLGIPFDYYDGYEGINVRGSWMAGRAQQQQCIEPEGEVIGYIVYDFDNERIQMVYTFMIDENTDLDDQDWEDFKRINRA